MKQSLMGVDLTGKRMMFRPRPIEFQCPRCHDFIGEGGPAIQVVVLHPITDVVSHRCGEVMLPDGWWMVEYLGRHKAVPYTLLEEIPE